MIPAAKVDTVFKAAIAACKERTARHVTLPPGESFVVEYVKDKPWSGYNWYKGDFHSVIQVNTSLPIYIDRAVDLACHEGYPGHHVYNALLEKHLVRDRGWMEFSVYPLFSPAVADRGGQRELRHRDRVSRRGAHGVRARRRCSRSRVCRRTRPTSTTAFRSSCASCRTPATRRRGAT